MKEALYRKHRPKKLEDVVGQPHITTTLTNAIKSKRVSHGYLFAGPRGVGKTSVARILAYQVNGFTYGDSNGSLDIIEIDGASNRRIDEIRDLRDKVHITPVIGKYKIYIIDEAHMLTREAFNALLKTLEEPPSHVIFILATTEIHKLPETIISRTQRYIFKNISPTDVVSHLKNLAKQEGITINDKALALIAEHGEGSFRDSISLLDQLSNIDSIKEQDVQTLLGLPTTKLINSLFSSITNHDIPMTTSLLNDSFNAGASPIQIASALIDKIRADFLNQQSKTLIRLGRELILTKSASDPSRYLELTIMEHILSSDEPLIETKKNQTTKKSLLETTQSNPNTTKNADVLKEIIPEVKNEPKISKASVENDVEVSTNHAEEIWDQLLTRLKKQYNTLYGLARMGKPSIKENVFVLKVPFAFHQKRLTEDKNRQIIQSIISDILNRPINYKVEFDLKAQKDKNKDPSSDKLESVTKIFGGGEILDL